MKRVLVVDDEQQAIDVFKAALTSVGYEVEVSDSGKHALELVKASQFDVMIVDEMMPDMSGNSIIKVLRQDPATAKLPIIVLTNFNDDQLVKEAIAAGANDYILKYQMTPDDLSMKIKDLIGE
ncbi:MAG TPA: response regulator [Patescibacteria group bacterium]|nr:response regulator [Patescibacteria group bacterium]